MAETRKRTMKRSQRPNQAVQSNVYYVAEIVKWSWGASFGLWEEPGKVGKSYHGIRHLKLCGRFVQPSQLSETEVQFTFVPDERLNRENQALAQLSSIGRLSLRAEAIGLVSIPADVLPCLLTMLCANQFKFLVLRGTPPRNHQVNLHFLSFEMQINSEDFADTN
ncbi:hypothetical protein ACD578_07830 [Microvirga sp. RSM25]|uniref:hypothetical protein n=1 Tax=Microvirga sp. RSM25 TaxID=3273802 RepID=UPI00384B293A